jgi:hypothetical protein
MRFFFAMGLLLRAFGSHRIEIQTGIRVNGG